MTYYLAGRCGEAIDEYAKTAQLQKPAFDLLLDWALAYDCAGNADEAIAKLRQAAALENSAHVYSQIGMMYGKHGRDPEALDALATAIQLNPKFAMAYYYRRGAYEG